MRASGRARADSNSIDTASWITLRWTRRTRYFRVHLERHLWRQWLLTQVDGRSGSPLRKLPNNACGVDRGRALFQRPFVAKRRRQRGRPTHELEW